MDMASSRSLSPLSPLSSASGLSSVNMPVSLINLYRDWAGNPPGRAVRLVGAGSDRVYWRMQSDSGLRSAIGVQADNRREAEAFVALARYFSSHGISVPEIYGVAEDDPCVYLQQDLGSQDLFSLLPEILGSLSLAGGNDVIDAPVLTEVLTSLARMQTLPAEEWKDIVGFPPLSERQVMWDLNYFKYEYLKPSGIDFSEEALEDDFEAICRRILEIPSQRWGFMMRDCQSRNVMVSDGQSYWIDFQGGRMGPALYDAVSFVYQARAAFPACVSEALLRVYADRFSALRGMDPDDFLSDLPLIRLFRSLQVMGAYGFRGLVQHRAHFIQSISMGLANLSSLCDAGAVDDYPELHRIVRILAADSRFRSSMDSGLEVKVFSFSYKKGYPDDFSGNGGGFMFDCRALPNPGRYEEYKQLTGLDLPVIDFLKEHGEVDLFLENAENLVAHAVDCYLKRGLTSLQIGFGCTGGQHRSVYCAETMAGRLAGRFPDARILAIHRERGVSSVKSEGKL